MSQPSSPARPDPARDTNAQSAAPAPAPAQSSSDQAWKIVALAVALMVLALLLFFLFTGATTEQSAPPQEETSAEEEEAEEAPAPAPPPSADDPRPSSRSSSRGSEGTSAPPDGELPPLNILSVGYSPVPALRVVALRIGGALPYFMHEGDSIGDVKILAIMSDRVQISHKGKKYEIRAGSDGQVHLPAHAR